MVVQTESLMFIFAQSLAHALLVLIVFNRFVVALQHCNMFYYAKTQVFTTRCLIDEPDVEFDIHLNVPFLFHAIISFQCYILVLTSILFLTLKRP